MVRPCSSCCSVVGLGGGLGIAKVKGWDCEARTVEPPPEAGRDRRHRAINVNLADGHFLRIGRGRPADQRGAEKPEAWAKIEGAIVRDVIVDVFSGQVDGDRAVDRRAARTRCRDQDERSIESTEKDVMKVYLTEFVASSASMPVNSRREVQPPGLNIADDVGDDGLGVAGRRRHRAPSQGEAAVLRLPPPEPS